MSKEAGKIKKLGVMLDCSRGAVYHTDTLRRFFPLLAKMGYNYVQLYTEDTYEIAGEPRFGYMRGRYSKADLKAIDALAQRSGLELVPCIQTLAHLSGISRWYEYQDTCIDLGDILLVGEESTYALIEKMFQTCAECFTSRRINIGMDEAHMVGLGKYLDRHGYENRFEILMKHLIRVTKIAEKYGFSPMMWSDMFFRLMNGGEYYGPETNIPAEVTDKIPADLTMICWDYYHTDKAEYDRMLGAHRRAFGRTVFAGGAWSWCGFVPSNRFSIRASEAAIRSCLEYGIDDVFITCWKDDGAECSLFSSLPALFSAAEFSRGNFDRADIADKFCAMTGVGMETFLAMDDIDAKGEGRSNLSKYMLYSDPFLGIFDRTVRADGIRFSAVRERLEEGTHSARYGYIFRTLAALCDVLEIKYTLGARTREGYRKGDKAALALLAEEYGVLERRLEKFYAAFRAQWDKECRQNGFEVHDIRLGGLVRRVAHCRRMLNEYCTGRTERIPALEEEPMLPFADGEGESVLYNSWLYTAMVRPLS